MTDTSTVEPPLSQEISRIDTQLDRRRVGDMTVDKFAGLTFKEYRDAIEFSKLVTQAKHGLPGFLKNNGADCLIVTTLALRWRLEPVWVMQNSYIAKSDGLINYENFVFAAVLNASGALKGKPRYHYSGEGEDRVCTVSATFVGESEAHTYTTPPLKQCRPPRNDSGQVKGSPLWDKDPDQQLGYFAVRNFARRHIPELLGGVYSRDEFEDSTQQAVDDTPASPNLIARLPARVEGMNAGFQPNVIDDDVAREVEQEQAKKKPRAATEKAMEEPSENPAAQEPVEDKTVWRAPLADTDLTDEDMTDTAPSASPPDTGQPLPQPRQPAHTKPKTASEYQGYVMAWLEQHTDPDEIEARWDGQKELRASLKVTLPMRKQLEAAVKARVNKLRGK
jgi:hypothetical protein